MNTYDELRRLRRQQPFVSFVILLKEGRQLNVVRRVQFAFNEERGAVIDDETGIEHFKLADITALKELHAVN